MHALQTDAKYYAKAEYHGPYSVINSLIHAACHYKQIRNKMLQLNIMIPTLSYITGFMMHALQTDAEYYAAAEYHAPRSVPNNLIHAACHRKQMQNTML